MAGAEVGHPGQRAAHDVAALDLAALQFELLNSEKALHRIGKAGAAEDLPGRDVVGEVFQAPDWPELNAYQASVFWHHAMKAVAPQTSPSAAID